jgi:hypothetical protein
MKFMLMCLCERLGNVLGQVIMCVCVDRRLKTRDTQHTQRNKTRELLGKEVEWMAT